MLSHSGKLEGTYVYHRTSLIRKYNVSQKQMQHFCETSDFYRSWHPQILEEKLNNLALLKLGVDLLWESTFHIFIFVFWDTFAVCLWVAVCEVVWWGSPHLLKHLVLAFVQEKILDHVVQWAQSGSVNSATTFL